MVWEARLEVDAYYALLGCTATSTPEEVSKSYRRLSLRVHPDKPGGSEAAFQQLTRAHEVIKDEKKAKAYSRFGLDLGDDDDGATELCQELGQRCGKAMGAALIRSVALWVACVGLRRGWFRLLTALLCFAGASYGYYRRRYHPIVKNPDGSESTSGDDIIRLAGFALALPFGAWVAAYLNVAWLFEAALYGVVCGGLEVQGYLGYGLAAIGFILRWLLGARWLVFVKLLVAQVGLLIFAHGFFHFLAALVNEILDQKLSVYATHIRAACKQAATARPPPPAASPPKAGSTPDEGGPTRRRR